MNCDIITTPSTSFVSGFLFYWSWPVCHNKLVRACHLSIYLSCLSVLQPGSFVVCCCSLALHPSCSSCRCFCCWMDGWIAELALGKKLNMGYKGWQARKQCVVYLPPFVRRWASIRGGELCTLLSLSSVVVVLLSQSCWCCCCQW